MRPPQSPQSAAPLWQTVSHSVLVRYILLFVCGWITVVLINFFYGTIALFSIAGMFAALLNYPVVWLSRYVPRWLAITLTFLSAIVIVLGLVGFVSLQVLNQGQVLLSQFENPSNQQAPPLVQDLLNQVDISSFIRALETGLSSGLDLVKKLFSSLFLVIFGMVICLYMVIDGEKLWNMSLKIIPAASRDRFAATFQLSFLGFIWGTIILMLYYSISSLLLFSLIGVNQALVLAVILGLLDAIPGIGAILGMVLVTILVFFSQGGFAALQVFGITLLLEQIQENYVRPKVMKDELELNPVLLFLSLFIGQQVAGLLGIFLAVPIAGMIGAWMRSLEEERMPALAEPLENVDH